MGRLEGEGVREIKKTVKSAFENQGFTVLIDRGGHKWELSQYAEMLTRTHLIKANNEGVLNRAGDFNIDVVQISSHGATDEACGSQEGKIYSVSGKNDYPLLGDNEPPFHPNCKHSLLMRPDLDVMQKA
jgi:methionine aminopeptidase